MKKMMKRLAAVVLAMAMLFSMSPGSALAQTAESGTIQPTGTQESGASAEASGIGLQGTSDEEAAAASGTESISGESTVFSSAQSCPLTVTSVAGGEISNVTWDEAASTLTVTSGTGVRISNKDSSTPAKVRLVITSPTVVFDNLNLDGNGFADSSLVTLCRYGSNGSIRLILSGGNRLTQTTGWNRGVLSIPLEGDNDIVGVTVEGAEDASLTIEAQTGKSAFFLGKTGGSSTRRPNSGLTVNSGRIIIPSGGIEVGGLYVNNGALDVSERIICYKICQIKGGSLTADELNMISKKNNSTLSIEKNCMGLEITGGTVDIGTLKDDEYNATRTRHNITGGNVTIGTVKFDDKNSAGYCQLVGTVGDYSGCKLPLIIVPCNDGTGAVKVPQDSTITGNLSDLTIPSGCELIIPEGVTLHMNGGTVNNYGVVRVLGTLDQNGTWNGNPPITESTGAYYQVEGGTAGTDYAFRWDGLHILSNTAMVVKPATDNRSSEPRIWVDSDTDSLTIKDTTAASDGSMITVSAGKTVSLTIQDCNLISAKGAAIELAGEGTGLTLNVKGTNGLAAGADRGAVEVNEKNSVVIQGDGSLAATGGSGGAAIGGGSGHYQGPITIQGDVVVSAMGGGQAAGIGGGSVSGYEIAELNNIGFPGNEIRICGNARVSADSESGVGIGGGSSRSNLRIPMDGMGLLKDSRPENALMQVTITDNAQVTATGSGNTPAIGGSIYYEYERSSTPVKLTVNGNASVLLKGSAGLGDRLNIQQGEWSERLYNCVGPQLLLSGNARLTSEGNVLPGYASSVYNDKDGEYGTTAYLGFFSATVEENAVLCCHDGISALKARIETEKAGGNLKNCDEWANLYHFTGGILLDSSARQILFLGNNAALETGSDTGFELTGALEFPENYGEFTFPDNFVMTVNAGSSLDINQIVKLGNGSMAVKGTVTVGGELHWNGLGSGTENLTVNTGGKLQKVNGGQIIPARSDASTVSPVPVITQAQVQGVTLPSGIKTYGEYTFDGAAADVQLTVKNGSIAESDYSKVWKVNGDSALYSKLKAGTLDAGQRYTLELTLSLGSGWNGTFDDSLNGLQNGAACTRSSDGRTLTMAWSFTVSPKTMPDGEISLEKTEFEHTGSEIRPVVTLPASLASLKKDQDYTVTYHNNTNPGTGMVVVTGIGNYRGMKQMKFTITGGYTLQFLDYLKSNSYKYDYNGMAKKLTASELRLVADSTGTIAAADPGDVTIRHYLVKDTGEEEVESMLLPGTYRVEAALISDPDMKTECTVTINKLYWTVSGYNVNNEEIKGYFHKVYDGTPLDVPTIEELKALPGVTIEGGDLEAVKDRIEIYWASDSTDGSGVKNYRLDFKLPETEIMKNRQTYAYYASVGKIDPLPLEIASVKLENRDTGEVFTSEDCSNLAFGTVGICEEDILMTVTLRRQDGEPLNLSEKADIYVNVTRGYSAKAAVIGDTAIIQWLLPMTFPANNGTPFDITIINSSGYSSSCNGKLVGSAVDADGKVSGSCEFDKRGFASITITPTEAVKPGTTLTAKWKKYDSSYNYRVTATTGAWYRINNGVKTLIVESDVSSATKDTYMVTADDIGCDIEMVLNCTDDDNYGTAVSAPVTVEKYENTDASPTDGVVDDTANTFGFTPAAGKADTDYEYSTDGGQNWTDVTVNPIQVGEIRVPAGDFQVRQKATDTIKPGDPLVSEEPFTTPLTGTVTLVGDVIYGETLQAQVAGAQADAGLSYQWSVDGTVVADENGDSYTLRGEDIGKKVSVKVTDTSLADTGLNYTGYLSDARADTVAKRSVTVTAEDWRKKYGQPDPAELVWEITSGELAAGDTLSLSVTRTAGENVGQYDITVTAPAGAAQNDYYTVTVNTPKLIIGKAAAELQVSATPAGLIAGREVTVTVRAVNAESGLMGSGWNQPASLTVSVGGIGALSDTVAMTKRSDGNWQGSYTVPADTAAGTLNFTAEIADGNYVSPAAGTTASVNVTAATYTMVLDGSAVSFDTAPYGSQPAAKHISVRNTGNTDIQITKIELTGANPDAYELEIMPATGRSVAVIPAGGDPVTVCTVKPRTGLDVGTYSAELVITYTGGQTVRVSLSFQVDQARRDVPEDGAWTIDWRNETVAYNGTVYEMSTAKDGTGTSLVSGADLGAYAGKSVYIRAVAQNPANYLPSDWKEIKVPARPAAPVVPAVTERTSDEIRVEKQEDQEYRWREVGGTWSDWQEEAVFDGLTPDTDYELQTRKKAVDGSSFTGEEITFTAATKQVGAIENVSYPDSFVYTGSAVQTPERNQFNVAGDGKVTFLWYRVADGERTLLAAAPAESGEYVLEAKLAATESYAGASAEVTVNVSYLEADETTVSGPEGYNDWHTGPVTITAPENYQLVFEDMDDPADSREFTEDGEYTVLYRLTDGNGHYTELREFTVRKDTAVPTGTVTVGKNSWAAFLEEITFEHYAAENQTVKVSAADRTSGVASVELYRSEYAMTLDELKAINTWREIGEETVTAEDGKRFLYYARITDKAGNAAYLSSSGTVFDTTAPAVTGASDGLTAYDPVTLNVADENLLSVLYQKDGGAGNSVPVEDGKAALTLPNNEKAVYTVIAIDRAGNETVMKINMQVREPQQPESQQPQQPGTDVAAADDDTPLTELIMLAALSAMFLLLLLAEIKRRSKANEA